LSLSNIERIEIVRGSASAQYGSDALGGVINIITKKSKEPSVMVGISTGSESINNYYHIRIVLVKIFTCKKSSTRVHF